MSLYVALFLATLAPAVVTGIRRGGDGTVVAIVLIASFSGAHLSWGSQSPVLANAMMDLVCAAVIVALCHDRWSMTISLMFLGAVAYGVITQLIDAPMHAHVLSAIGHGQNIGLIIGGRDAGLRKRIPGRQLGMAVRR